jgi:Ca2+-binding RTX toxin-like protein
MSRSTRPVLLLSLTLGAGLLLGLSPAMAFAASVNVRGSKLVIEAGLAEGANEISVTRQGRVLVVEGKPNMNAGSGCRQNGSRKAGCRGSATRISANLRDGNDEFVSSAVDLAVTLKGGAGNDTVSTGGRRDRLDGESGDDDLSAGPGKDRLTGGPGIDSLNGEEGNDILNAVDGAFEGNDGEIDCGRGTDRSSIDLVDLDTPALTKLTAKALNPTTGGSLLRLNPPGISLGCENLQVAAGDQQPTLRVDVRRARLGRGGISLTLLCPAAQRRGCKGRFELGRKRRTLGARSYNLGRGERRLLHFNLSRGRARSLRGKQLRGVAVELGPNGRPKATFASFKPRFKRRTR